MYVFKAFPKSCKGRHFTSIVINNFYPGRLFEIPLKMLLDIVLYIKEEWIRNIFDYINRLCEKNR